MPEISLTTCRVEDGEQSAGGGKGRLRFIVEGARVLHGAAPPLIDIGGQEGTQIKVSTDRKVMIGRIPGNPETGVALVDHGFAKDSCKIDPTGFTRSDGEMFERLMTPREPRRETKTNLLRRVWYWVLKKVLQNRR